MDPRKSSDSRREGMAKITKSEVIYSIARTVEKIWFFVQRRVGWVEMEVEISSQLAHNQTTII